MPSVSVAKQRQIEQQVKQVRDELLNECGYPISERRKLVRAAIDKFKQQLEAKKVIVVDKDTEEVVDNQAQLRAAEAIIALEGVSLGKQHEGGSGGPVTVVVNANWFDPGPTTNSGEGTVIESGPAKLLEDKEIQ